MDHLNLAHWFQTLGDLDFFYVFTGDIRRKRKSAVSETALISMKAQSVLQMPPSHDDISFYTATPVRVKVKQGINFFAFINVVDSMLILNGYKKTLPFKWTVSIYIVNLKQCCLASAIGETLIPYCSRAYGLGSQYRPN